MMPSMRINSKIATVRIRRLAQNGMVIRNSHSERYFAGLVGMNHAVGKPISNVNSVVRIDKLTDRRKIDRCASAQT